MSTTASTQTPSTAGVLATFSDELAATVERVGRSVVRVDAGRRYPASGVVWSEDGLILTVDHAIEQEEEVEVGLHDGATVKATIAGRDAGHDVALLRINAKELVAIQRGLEPRIGHLTLAVARPGRGLATSIGVIAAISPAHRGWRGGQSDNLIWTDASLYPGYGGAALADTAGQMIGLATSTARSGAGLALPLETLERVATALQHHGRIKRGFLGIGSQQVEIPASLRAATSLQQEHGLLVMAVEHGGPADAAGMIIGDVLVTLAGQAVGDHQELLALLGSERVGQPTPVRIIRGGEPRDVTITVGERE
jgi:serine protease DegQ